MRANLFDPNRVRRRKKYKGKKKAAAAPQLPAPPSPDKAVADQDAPPARQEDEPRPEQPQEAPAEPTNVFFPHPGCNEKMTSVRVQVGAVEGEESPRKAPLVMDIHTPHLGLRSDEEGEVSDAPQTPHSPPPEPAAAPTGPQAQVEATSSQFGSS